MSKASKIRLEYKTVFISDTHLGMSETGIRKLNHFLAHIRCKTLVLNGDFIDGWALKRSGGWRKEHTRCIRLILKMVEKKHTNIIYVRGNHDDFIKSVTPLIFDRIRICEHHIFKNMGRKYLVVHGDCFDSFSTKHKWIAKIGSIGYDNLMRFNRLYNRYRKFRGLKPFSHSLWAKKKVKSAVNHVHRYEESLAEMARRFQCQGMICGHIHVPCDRFIDDIRYLNSGDWVETNSCIVEHRNGKLEVLYYFEFLKNLRAKQAVINLNDSSPSVEKFKNTNRSLVGVLN